MNGKEIRLGFGGGNVRVWIPFTWAGYRYYWNNRKWPIIGVYGFNRFITQRDEIMSLKSKVDGQSRQLSDKNERLKAMGKELSACKRGNKETAKLLKRIEQLEQELDEARLDRLGLI